MNTLINRHSRLERLSRRLMLTTFMVVLAMAPVIVWAETAAPSPNLKKAPPAWVGLGIMFILAALVVSISLLPAKRGHQD